MAAGPGVDPPPPLVLGVPGRRHPAQHHSLQLCLQATIIIIIVKLREREGQRVDLGRSLKGGGGGDCVIIRALTQEYNGNVEFPRFLNLGPS